MFNILQEQRYNTKQKAFALMLYKTMGKHNSLRNIFKEIQYKHCN